MVQACIADSLITIFNLFKAPHHVAFIMAAQVQSAHVTCFSSLAAGRFTDSLNPLPEQKTLMGQVTEAVSDVIKASVADKPWTLSQPLPVGSFKRNTSLRKR